MNAESQPLRDSGIVLAPGEEILIPPEVAADWKKQTAVLRQIRGNVIANSIDIEFAMDTLIRELLFSHEWETDQETKKKIDSGRKIFDYCVSKSGAITFNGKINILRLLLTELRVIEEKDKKQLFKTLEDVRKVRNKFAHKNIGFEQRANTEKITAITPYFIENGRKVYLNNEYFDALNKLYSECMTRVENVTRKINKEPPQPLPDNSVKQQN